MLNSIVLTGNLGADPEMFYSAEGNPVSSFSLAFRAPKQKTGWIKITAFGKLAEISEKYLHKGARIAVSGTLDVDQWKADNGQNRTKYKVIAQTLEFIKVDGSEGTEDDIPF